ncbi:MAG: protein-L-isoaspartate O-methyltransferase [Xanthomonadales bacterium]|nr:protein-L-isoaspartate O-methyltransferase [Xanthomonadales bacterium]
MPSNLEQAHANMVDNQVRGWDVLNMDVLNVLASVRRADFVAPAWRHLAYMDLVLPLAHGESMMKPVIEGRMLQALRLQASDDVLEIGTGSGYITACMARMAQSVTSIEVHSDLAAMAQTNLNRAALTNTDIVVAEAVHAYQAERLFDVIVVTGAVASLPLRWCDWLNPRGRLFVIRGQSPSMHAYLLERQADGSLSETNLFDTDLPYLLHAQPAQQFTL